MLALVLLCGATPVWAGVAQDKVTLYFFWAHGCPHCLEEKRFLHRLSREFPGLEVVELELTTSAENRELLRRVAQTLGAELAAVPFTVVGRTFVVGWQGEANTGTLLRQAVAAAVREGWPDVVAPLRQAPAPAAPRVGGSHRLVLPGLGEIDLGKLPLLTLTLLLGALDGFNPCAMWALVFLIGLLLGMENRKRRWVLGSVFILGSGLVYFLFMAAWLNIFLFLGLIVWIRWGIGLVALAAGAVNLRSWWRDHSGTCPYLGSERRRTFLERLQRAVDRQSFWLAAGGVFLLGVAVNLVELFCSIGLPVVYTQILALTPLPGWAYYGLLSLYILVFMLDDLVVFVVSMLTLEYLGLTHRYQRFSHLLGGVVLLAIGLALILKPEWLRFA
ncbi:MAG: thioredoxin family protein [Syntrophobacterales bacterium]|nr:thioredoxin family protein [Syntrophobacterales bacterium]